jgi:hypothetical protein
MPFSHELFVLHAMRTTHYTHNYMNFQQFINQIVNNSDYECEKISIKSLVQIKSELLKIYSDR